MIKQVDVYYNGWGEHWLWGTLRSTTALSNRPKIVFEYTAEALTKGLELSAYTLPLQPQLHDDFPDHQLGLPGPIYDALPDGWGMLLMDRLFKQRGLYPARIGPLERLTYVGDNAMGALSFSPSAAEAHPSETTIPLALLAEEVQEVLNGEGAEFVQRLLQMGGSPHGARPKALVYIDPKTNQFSTAPAAGLSPWLIKFPALDEHPEVCAVEAVYSVCLRLAGIDTPDTLYYSLPNGQTAFATQRFDRVNGMRVPMQSLAAFTSADFRTPGALDYTGFLRATQLCTNDIREKEKAFKRALFNVVFNNRDDHPKNFAYLMSPNGQWTLAPAYDVTFNEGPGGYHQMDVMGEALNIDGHRMRQLGRNEAELPQAIIDNMIDEVSAVASQFSQLAQQHYPQHIRPATLAHIQKQIDGNVSRLGS